MRLFIIGNGFDRHHGLKTSYEDYKEFLSLHYPEIVKAYEEFHYLCIQENTSLWSNIEEALAVDYDELIENTVTNYYPDVMDDHQDFGAMEYDVYVQTKFIKYFTGIYFYDWLSNVNTYSNKCDLSFDDSDLFINFNYTDTLQTIYHINKNNVLHVHGAVNNLKTLGEVGFCDIHQELQFGANLSSDIIGGELQKKYQDCDFNWSIKLAINELCQFIDLASKNPINNYKKIYSFLSRSEIDEVVVIGHSLNSVDDKYYQDIFLPKYLDVKWTFFLWSGSEKDKVEINKFIKLNGLKNYAIRIW